LKERDRSPNAGEKVVKKGEDTLTGLGFQLLAKVSKAKVPKVPSPSTRKEAIVAAGDPGEAFTLDTSTSDGTGREIQKRGRLGKAIKGERKEHGKKNACGTGKILKPRNLIS